LLVGVLAAIFSCPLRSLAATARGGRVVMATVLEVTVVAPDQDLADALVEEAFDVARHWDDVLTTWRPEGELARLNAAAGSAITISSDLMAVLVRMRTLSLQTHGAFDPGVGPLVERLRSGDHDTALPRDTTDRFHIRTALHFLTDKVRLLAGARIDAGGIGKGIALDAIATRLAGRASAYYLDFGGSSQLASGRPEDAPAWKLIVAGDAVGEVLGTIALDDASLSTSRTHVDDDGAGAIIDPFSFAPVEAGRLATVLAGDATTAEAWSTALVVLGPAGLAHAEAVGVQALYETGGKVVMTKGFPLIASRP